MLSTHRSMTRLAGLLVAASFVFVACSGTGGGPVRRARRPAHGCARRRRRRRRAISRRSPCRTAGATTASADRASRPSTASRSTSSTLTAARRRRSTRSRPTRTNPGPQAPDVIDVGLSFGPQAQDRRGPRQLQGRHLGRHPGRGQGRRRRLVRRLLRRAEHSRSNTTVVQNAPKSYWPDLLKPEYKGQVALVRRPDQVQPGDLRPCGRAALANGGSLDNVAARPRLLQEAERHRATSCRSSPSRRPSPRARPRSVLTWTYTALADRDKLAGNPPSRSACPDRRQVRGHVRPGHQRLRAASERGPAVGGVPVLRRGPAHLAEGLLQPDPL